jgi:hypothetical protein
MSEAGLRNELLVRGLSDMLQLSELISVTSRLLNLHPHDPEIMRPTLDVIFDLLDPGYAIAGDTIRDIDNFLYVRSWKLSPTETVTRIESEWRNLERPPNLGDVVWLELTGAGRIEARRHVTDQL